MRAHIGVARQLGETKPQMQAGPESGGERAAVQTLRELQRLSAVAERLECGGFSTAFGLDARWQGTRPGDKNPCWPCAGLLCCRHDHRGRGKKQACKRLCTRCGLVLVRHFYAQSTNNKIQQ